MKKIGFIGVGIMGKSMVRNLKKAGFDLHIYARTKAKVEDVIAEGVTFHDSIADCVKDCEAVITIVGFPQDVEEVYFDQGNILDSAKEGAYLIDMTTTSPQIAQKIYEEGNKRGFHVLDAPVTGLVPVTNGSTVCIVKRCIVVYSSQGLAGTVQSGSVGGHYLEGRSRQTLGTGGAVQGSTALLGTAAADHGYPIAGVLLLNDHSGLGLWSHGNSFFVIVRIVFHTQLRQHCRTVSVYGRIGIVLGREDQVEF